mgnify:CR=1 FL=1
MKDLYSDCCSKLVNISISALQKMKLLIPDEMEVMYELQKANTVTTCFTVKKKNDSGSDSSTTEEEESDYDESDYSESDYDETSLGAKLVDNPSEEQHQLEESPLPRKNLAREVCRRKSIIDMVRLGKMCDFFSCPIIETDLEKTFVGGLSSVPESPIYSRIKYIFSLLTLGVFAPFLLKYENQNNVYSTKLPGRNYWKRLRIFHLSPRTKIHYSLVFEVCLMLYFCFYLRNTVTRYALSGHDIV